jgi:hypothetical protein
MSAPSFDEIKRPLPKDEALTEANRCLFCYDAPCMRACPTHIDVPGFIKKIATGNLRGSARTILESNILGASCARVCPTEELCEGACVLKRPAPQADRHRSPAARAREAPGVHPDEPQGVRRRGLHQRWQRSGQRRRRRARRGAGDDARVAAAKGAMADLSIDMCGIKSPNPFWLASAPPANTGEQVMRAFDAGWGGAVWKTLGQPDRQRLVALRRDRLRRLAMMGLNNIELITDRPAGGQPPRDRRGEAALPEARRHRLADGGDEARVAGDHPPRRGHRLRRPGAQLRLPARDVRARHGQRRRPGAQGAHRDHPWAKEFARTPVLIKLTPNVGDILEPGLAAVAGGADGLSLINTIKSIVGVDLDRMVPLPRSAAGAPTAATAARR